MNENMDARLQGMSVAAVVVTYNRKEILRECLLALLSQTKRINEIIVIDGPSTDGTTEMVKEVEVLVDFMKG